MLSAEEARARLASFADEAWLDAADQRVRKLKRRLRPTAESFLVDLRDRTRFRDHDERARTHGRALDELTESERVQVFEALHPRLGATLARHWVDLRRRPYTVGWTRRSFRSPNNTVRTASRRFDRLQALLGVVGPYPHDVAWFASWAPHVERHGGNLLGQLFATAIDAGGPAGDAVYDTLVATANGDHPIAVFGNHVVDGLLGASRPDGWELVRHLLLAAQRQEGLRQAILEAADAGHPDAFRLLLATVVEHDLLRFAASVRAVAVWLGLPADVEQIPLVAERVTFLRSALTDTDACRAALEGEDAWALYIGLCAVAMHDVDVAVRWCAALRHHPDRDVRAAVLRFLAAASLTSVRPWIVEALTDADLDVAMSAAHQIGTWHGQEPATDVFTPLWELARRLPDAPYDGDTIGVDAQPVLRDRDLVLRQLISHLGDRPVDQLLPWLPSMGADARRMFAERIGTEQRLTPGVRSVVFELLGDRSSSVRSTVARIAARLDLDEHEAEHVEALLTRKAGDTRRTAIALLSNQPPLHIATSAMRLWETGNAAQREAACELLPAIPERSRAPVVDRFVADGATDRQRELMGAVLTLGAVESSDREDGPDLGPGSPASTDPGLGLFDPRRRTRVPAPRLHDLARLRGPDAVLRCLGALDDLAHGHRDDAVVVATWNGSREMLLGDVRGFPTPFGGRPTAGDGDEEGRGLLLPEVFRPWWAGRADDLRGEPGVEVVQAVVALEMQLRRTWQWGRDRGPLDVVDPLVASPVGELRSERLVQHVLWWMLVDDADRSTVAHCLDALESAYARVPSSMMRHVEKEAERSNRHLVFQPDRVPDWRQVLPRPWSHVLVGLRSRRPEIVTDDLIARWFRIERYFDEPVEGAVRHPVDRRLLLDAHRIGAATDDDVRDSFLARRSPLLAEATRHRRERFVEQHPRVAALADEMRARIVAIERNRGELPTAATQPSSRLASIEGAELATELLSRLGRANLVRGWAGGEGREAVYSRLLRVSHPATDDTPDALRAAAKRNKLSDQRLLELAMYAPQWVALVEGALGWDGLADAVWWFHAHTKDTRWTVSADVREGWQVLSAERTPLSADDLLEGAVDVEWFHRAHRLLGADRWAKVHKTAKLASGGNGHRRAQVFAEALLGESSEETLVARIRGKRNQDAVRALGLLPIPHDRADRTAVMLRRYGVMREFERGSSKFGSQRKTSERLAVRIAVENLARSAGFVDPQRFIWSTEAAEAGDLADGPVSVVEGEVTVTLSVDGEGLADIAVDKGGRALKSVPPALRKHPDIKGLQARKTALVRQATRVRRALEDAMVRQDAFVLDDVHALQRHSVLAPMLRLVTFVDDDGVVVRWRGDDWSDSAGESATPAGGIRLAHPVDLVASGDWIRWQERLFADATRQPFKQVFRELYVPTDGERAAGPGSRRYEGHQLQPRQALALFGNRGWTSDRESGEVWRVFHQHGITAHVDFLEGFLTPAEVELPSIDRVAFTRRADARLLPLDAVPPVVFSETMRDLDLVVSVAHAGGVDPEATASTVEMRAALARETIRLTKLDNVRIEHHHLLIDGTLGEYSVHLGSGVVHRRPGGAVCIIPVAAQRRGRLFLPFADDDPKTAEIMSKLLLLARDDQIKDPSILSQLR